MVVLGPVSALVGGIFPVALELKITTDPGPVAVDPLAT
jgi:hypothetical protein